MEKVKLFQGQLLRYFKFGSTEDEAKAKVKILAEDFAFLGIPIRSNIDSINGNPNDYVILMQFSDMGFIKSIRDDIDRIKLRNKELSHESIDKSEFTAQYLNHLELQFKSKEIARTRLKALSGHMKSFNCPIGDYLNGYVVESKRLNKLMVSSSMGIFDKILYSVDTIKNNKE